MQEFDGVWLGATLLLAVVAFLRYRSGPQVTGSLAVSSMMLLSAGFIVAQWHVAAQVVQCIGVAIALWLIVKERSWKRSTR